jgi:tRNA modification GTPase
MMSRAGETITAIATGTPPAAVAIIRVSGPQAWAIGASILNQPAKTYQAGRFYHGWAVDPQFPAEPLDEVLVLFFKAPHSFTGEDVIEIHGHGGDFITRRLLDVVLKLGARVAHAGEFTQRALLNGKLDLTQAESIMDLISAQGEAMIKLATANLKNRAIGGAIADLGEALILIQADIVAHIDFPDEVDAPDRADLAVQLDALLTRAEALAQSSHRNRLVREGFKVALLGLPNSGKSSLFNALLAEERAIVTDIAGTTRDVITETLPVAGIPVTLIDTAGIRETANTIELLGIERTWQAADTANAILYVFDATVGLLREDRRILQHLQTKLPQIPVKILANKMDQVGPETALHETVLPLSAKTGLGVDPVLRWLEGLIQQQTGGSEAAISLNQRQRQCLEAMGEQMRLAHQALTDPYLPLDMATFPLTEALRQLDTLLGKDTTEDVLGSVFARFCVGK